jgi:hypothetical protein
MCLTAITTKSVSNKRKLKALHQPSPPGPQCLGVVLTPASLVLRGGQHQGGAELRSLIWIGAPDDWPRPSLQSPPKNENIPYKYRCYSGNNYARKEMKLGGGEILSYFLWATTKKPRRSGVFLGLH